jgi:hypothetical protein
MGGKMIFTGMIRGSLGVIGRNYVLVTRGLGRIHCCNLDAANQDKKPMQRPVSVNVFGILNIVFAVTGVFGILGSIALFSMTEASQNPVVRIMRDSPTYTAWVKLTIPIGVAGCAVLLAAGIGLLCLKGWARKLSIGYAIYAIVFGMIAAVMNFMFLLRPLFEEAARKQGPEAFGAIGGAAGGAIGGCLGLVYPILLLVFMTRPKVVAAFEPAAAPPSLPAS